VQGVCMVACEQLWPGTRANKQCLQVQHRLFLGYCSVNECTVGIMWREKIVASACATTG
jgi:hypothetical protein